MILRVRVACCLAMLLCAPASAPVAAQAGLELVGEGVISTIDDELNASFSPDGNELYFCKYLQSKSVGVILVSHRKGASWSAPQVAPFSGRYTDFDPFVTPDGSELFFISNRPVGSESKTDFDIWKVTRVGRSWGEPVHLDAPINTPGDEYFPSVSRDGTLYFSAVRDGGQGRFDVYSASPKTGGGYETPRNLGPRINTTFNEIDNVVSADGNLLIFASTGRPGSPGRGDLYAATRKGNGEEWSEAQLLRGPVNSSAKEYAPGLSPDGRWLYVTSYRGFGDDLPSRPLTSPELHRQLRGVTNGLGNVYRVRLSDVMPSPQHTTGSPAHALLEIDRGFAARAVNETVAESLPKMFCADVTMADRSGFADGVQAAREALRRTPRDLNGRAAWTPAGVGVSADGRHGFTYGLMMITGDDGKQHPGKYVAYWTQRPDGWCVAAYKRAPGAAPAAAPPPPMMVVPPGDPIHPAADPARIAAYEESLRAAEQRFSDEAQTIGLSAAFAKHGDERAVNVGSPADSTFIVGARAIGAQLQNGAGPSPINWSAERVLVAASGDLGVTFGHIRLNQPDPQRPPRPFFTIWIRASPAHPWRYIAE